MKDRFIFSRSDQMASLLLIFGLLVMAGFRMKQKERVIEPVLLVKAMDQDTAGQEKLGRKREVKRFRGKIDVNIATQGDLEALPGIGPVMAKRIIEYRKLHGNFQSIEELLKVKGIGQKTLEEIRDYLTIRGSKTPGDRPMVSVVKNDSIKVLQGKKPSIKNIPKGEESFVEETPKKKVNINTATRDELINLPGIGPVIAQRIIEYRQLHGNFSSIEELLKVKGIGKKTFERLSDLITVEDFTD